MPRNDQTELTRPINGDLPSVTAEQVVLVSNTPISQISSPNPNLNYYHQNQPRYLDNVKFPNLSRLLQDTPWSTSPHVSQSSVAPKRENRKRSLECDASANDGEDGLELPLSSSLITTVLGGKVTVQMDASRFDYSPVFKKRNRTSPRHCQVSHLITGAQNAENGLNRCETATFGGFVWFAMVIQWALRSEVLTFRQLREVQKSTFFSQVFTRYTLVGFNSFRYLKLHGKRRYRNSPKKNN